MSVATAELQAWIDGRIAGDGGQDLVPGLSADDLLVSLVAAALEPAGGELELLDGAPQRDDTQFDGRPMPLVPQLNSWLYGARQRVAYAVHTPAWLAPSPHSPADQPSPALGRRPHPRRNWDRLLHDHFHSGQGWTAVSAVAMPVRVPFDEPGLRIAPLLALWAPVAPGDQWLNETMTMSVRHGHPHVVQVRIFSASLYAQSLAAAGHDTIALTPQRHALSLHS